MSTYQVQSGDSLWKITTNAYKGKGLDDSQIAKKVEELSIFNNIQDPSLINVNQVLDLSCFDDLDTLQQEAETQENQKQDAEKNEDSQAPKQEENKEVNKEVNKEADKEAKTYTIQSGDSLWKITKNYYGDISDSEIAQKVDQLAQYNNISNPSNINVNQVLDLSCFDDLNTSQEESNQESAAIDEMYQTSQPEQNQESEDDKIDEMYQTQEPQENQENQEPEDDEDAAIDEMYQTPTYSTNQLNSQINFRSENPENMEFSSQEIREKTIELYNASQNNALDKSDDAKHRNAPTIVEENGKLKVEANQEFYESTVQGPLSGMTVMVNSGHGGYNPSGTSFDPGACVGQEEEWIINQDYAEDLAQQLLLQGADVLMTQGQYETVAEIIPEFSQQYGDGKNNDNLKMISIHANANGNSSARGICYYWSNNNSEYNSDNDLADSLKEAAQEEGLNINYSSSNEVKILSTANKENIDNVLVELGFMTNPEDLDLLLNSEEYKQNMIDSIINGLIADA